MKMQTSHYRLDTQRNSRPKIKMVLTHAQGCGIAFTLIFHRTKHQNPVMFEVSFLENVSQVRYSDRKNVCYIFFIIQPLMQSRTVTSYIDRLPKLSKLQQKQ